MPTYQYYVPRLLIERRESARSGYWEAPGSLLFADVSGFTRLGERLSRHGKAGAEELVGTISDVFTALLTALQGDGDVLKFSGDALVIFFAGPHHARRAVSGAAAMQRALRRSGRIVTDDGVVRLRMTVGVNSGDFPFFLVGESHLELLVSGAPASATVAMEESASPGQVLVSPATAAAADGIRFVPGSDGGLVLRGRPPVEPVRSAFEADFPDAELASFIPKLLRGRLGPGTAEHEHRQATVAFLHFGGVDRLLHERGAPVVFDRLQHLGSVVERTTDEYGVCIIATDIDRDGGRYYLAAGTPDASDSDDERMLRACRAILDGGTGLPLRVGVNRGHVFGGDVGASFRRTYSVMGDTVNLAARIMGRAPVGGLLAHQDVVERGGHAFAIEPFGSFRVKGKSRPVPASLVGRPQIDERGARDRGALPLVGRDEELATIRSAAATAAGGFGQVVEVVGDAGIGKSRLLSEAVDALDVGRRLVVSCERYDRMSPYYAARILLRRALAIRLRASDDDAGLQLRVIVGGLAPHLLPWLPLLAVPVNATVPTTPEVEELDDRFRRARMFAAVDELLETVLPDSAIVLEDVHWMDDASAELVAYVLLNAVLRPWVIITARRDEPGGLRPATALPATRIHLRPLPEGAVRELVEARGAGGLPTQRVTAITERSAGNPLFLLELLDHDAPAGEETPLPDSVEAILAARIDQLPPDDRHVLRCVSALGGRFSARVLDAALGPLGITSTDHHLWERLSGFVARHEDGSFAFHHDLAREAAYEGLTYRRRRDLHARIAEVFERTQSDDESDHSAILSLHYHRAARYDRSWHWSVLAAERARRNFANVDAAHLYRRALEAAEHADVGPGDRARAAEAMGEAFLDAGWTAEALDGFRRARRWVRDQPIATIRLAAASGDAHLAAGRSGPALRWYGRAARALDSTGEVAPAVRGALLARIDLGYASARLASGDLQQAERWATDALAAAELSGDPRVRQRAADLLDAVMDASR